MAKAKISLSISVDTNNNTTYKITAKLYYHGNGSAYNGYSPPWKISATGQTTKKGSHSFTKSTSAQYLGKASFSWSKGTSSASKKVSASFNTKLNLGTLTTSKTITVPAKPYYTVTYANVNNAGAKTTKSVQYGASHALITPEAVTNYDFVGWKTSSGSTVNPGTKITVTGNVTYTAQWKLAAVTIKCGASSVTQILNSTVNNNVLTAITEFINTYNIDDTQFNGIILEGTGELIAKVKSDSTGTHKYTFDTLVDSSLFVKDVASGTFKYIGDATTKTLTYSYKYLNHNINRYYIDTNNSIKCITSTNISGTVINFNDKLNNISGYKPSGFYKKVDKPPTKLSDFIVSDVCVNNNIQYIQYGYVSKSTVQPQDTYYTSVYVNNSDLYTEFIACDVIRTTQDILGQVRFSDDTFAIDEYISAEGFFTNSELKDENGTSICGCITYKSPYNNNSKFIGLDNNELPIKGISGEYTIKINSDNLSSRVVFIDDTIYVKFWSDMGKEYSTNEFYYAIYTPANIVNDLNYPVDATPISIFIPSNTMILDVNKTKKIVALGTEAPDDIEDELILFGKPITLLKVNGKDDVVKYQQFIISHDVNIVNVSSGKYVVTTNCNLEMEDINNNKYNLELQKYDIINILKLPVNDNISVNIKLNRGNNSITYKPILI